MPVSTLRCTRTPCGISSPATASSTFASRASATSRLVATGPLAEDARGRELEPELERFRQRRDAERLRTRSERGAGRIDGTVAVGVRLDDGPQLRAAERANERAHVATQGTEVDRQLGALHQPVGLDGAARRGARICPTRRSTRG